MALTLRLKSPNPLNTPYTRPQFGFRHDVRQDLQCLLNLFGVVVGPSSTTFIFRDGSAVTFSTTWSVNWWLGMVTSRFRAS